MYDGTAVSSSRIMTSLDYGIASREAFEIFAQNHDFDALDYILELDGYGYYMMNILDYLVGNTDRHWGNWGLLIHNENNQPIRLHDLMDFNQSFGAYDTVDGTHCMTVRQRGISQKDAALEAVERVGLNQIAEIQQEWFGNRKNIYAMLMERLDTLRCHGRKSQ